MADYGIHLTEQGDRLAYAGTYSSDSAGPASYKKLKDLSEAWRYKGDIPNVSYVASAWRWAEALARSMDERWPPI